MYPLAAGINAKTKGESGKHFTVAADDETLAFCPLRGYLTERTVCPATYLETLVLVACSRNIDFNFTINISDNLLNVKTMFPFVNFILAGEVDMPSGNR
jgi:hypothetical protein